MKTFLRMLLICGTVRLFGMVGLLIGLVIVYGGQWAYNKLLPAKDQPNVP